MPKALPGFMAGVVPDSHKLSHNTKPSATDGSSTSGYGVTNGSNIMRGVKFTGQKKLPAKAGSEHVVAGSGGGKGGGGAQVSKPTRRGK